jgi:hypothetical protein
MVDKKSDQKIVIETDLTLLDNVDIFIKYINKFMKTKGFDENNITYSQSESLLFVIDGYYVKNSKEKQKFIQKLIQFIYTQYQSDKIVNTIKTFQHCEFYKSEAFLIPIGEYSSLTDVKNCKYLFEPKQIPVEVVANHNNVYVFTDHDFKQVLQTNLAKKSGWVYFIRDGGNVKVGKTVKLKRRISELQTGNSQKLEIIGYIESNVMDILETNFHEYLKPLWVRGEWFNLEQEKTAKMLQLCRKSILQYEF